MMCSLQWAYVRLSSLWADWVTSGLMGLRCMRGGTRSEDEAAPAALDPTLARPGSAQPVKRPLDAAAPTPGAGSEREAIELDTIALLDGPISTAHDDGGGLQVVSAEREREADEPRARLLVERAGADADDGEDAAVAATPSTPSAAAKRARLAPASEAAAPATSVVATHAPALVLPRARLLGLWERCVWSDEFEHDGLPDPSRWAFQTDANNWVHKPSHKELQWYTEGRLENARVQDGVLRICARREPWGGCEFTSARLRTKGLADWEYGRVEVCAKLPAARRGLWPAIWLVSSDNRYGSWPASGEIDVMENLGAEPGVLHGSVHTASFNHRKRSHKSQRTFRADAHEAFHVYSLEWSANALALAVDDEVFFEFGRQEGGGSEAWPFDHPFHLILNVAVGGNWGGKDGIADDVCPAEMQVAYVRVFQ